MVAKHNHPASLQQLREKANRITLMLTDNDGVLTDSGVYYSDAGEVLKRYNLRDGMGVTRLRAVLGIETGIVTGELSVSLRRRAEKLGITMVYGGVRDKAEVLHKVLMDTKRTAEEVAYIGDDYNDLEIIKLCGLTACPRDAMPAVREQVDYVCSAIGGHGAFRDFAELILSFRSNELTKGLL